MIVSVYDSDSDILTSAKQDGYEVERNIIQGVQNKTLIVGSTGETVIKRSEILAMDHNVYLVSTSSEQWEFCINELEALASEKMELKSSAGEVGTRYKIVNTEKYVNLVANGYPINFWKTESMPNEVSDLIMSLMFISAIEVAKNRSLEFKIDSEVTNRIAKEYELSETYLDFHK
jgi:S-adenosylhomocysteine hydrolase